MKPPVLAGAAPTGGGANEPSSFWWYAAGRSWRTLPRTDVAGAAYFYVAAQSVADGIRQRGEAMGKTRRNRVVAVLGAGGVLAAVLSATGPAALAQPASAQA